ncbi:MAG TPA: hypothetical protein VKG26_08550 [Bacteroidia bacterium]|nr:hypothetical protein [Bacteroidia bacterium]
MKFCSIIIKTKFFLVAFIVLLFSFSVQAQTSTSSPYSRFGIGKVEYSGFASNTALGGCYTAYQNDTLIPLFINQGNPASYSTNRITTFEIGGRASNTNFISDDGSVKKTNSGFNYISFAVPIKRNMGLAFGLLPFSNVGYNSTTYANVDSVGQIQYNYQGNGGINQAFAGFAIRPFEKSLRGFYRSNQYKALTDSGEHKVIRNKRFWLRALSSLSLGTNINFLYGTIDYYSYANYPYNYGTVFNTKQYTETIVHDVYFQGGAQMAFDIDSIGKHNLKNNLKIILGYSISLPKKVSATQTEVGYTFSSQANGIEQPFDTFSYKPSYKGAIYIPLMHSVGLGFKSGDKLTVLFDGGFQQWSKYSFFGDNQKLRDLYKASVGLQYLPNRAAIGSMAYIKRINYRIGARYNTGYLVLNNKSLSEYAFSAGVGLPAGGGRYKLFTMLNISAEYGVYGTTQNQLIQEKYIRFVLGLTFNDRWFIKTRYD